jgi:glycosyltransferase involved in cell wall biosynthesis
MNHNPFLTILTATFNSEQTLVNTIESIKNQGFKNFEHIIIDGASNDETINILQKYEKTYNQRWISEPDEGIADALNKGLRYATGKYILVIQADDSLLGPEVLESLYPLLSTERVDVYSFPVIFNHPEKGKLLRKPIRFLWWNHFKFIFPHQGCFVHRRVFDQVGGFRSDFKINLDYDFFYRALTHKCSVEFGNFPVALMGGYGIGSGPKNMERRLREERRVQLLNERNPIWKVAQLFFRIFYMLYKTYLVPKICSVRSNRDSRI